MRMKSKALTLVEVIISMVILSLLAAGLTKVFVSSGQWLFHGRALMTGTAVGKSFLDPLQLQVSQGSWNGGTCLTSDGSVCGAPQASLNNIPYTATYAVTPVGTVSGLYPDSAV